MASGGHSGLDPSGQGVKLEDTFTLLESQDLPVVDEISHLIMEHMATGKETWLVNSLVDYYYRTHSAKAKEILADVREPLDKTVMEKIQEGLKTADSRLPAMQLLLFIINHQPPWTHRLVERPLFSTLIKCLKTEIDIPILMTGVMSLVILLPVVPVTIGNHLQEVFDIFSRIAGLIVKKPGNAPDIFMLFLNVGVYVLFLRLYGMFPCSFTSFLTHNYAKKENLMVYSEIIAPILEKVRLHPSLVLGSKNAETDKSRWRKVEPQDIVVNCAKMSLDPIEGTREDQVCPVMPRPHPTIITSITQASAKQHQPQPLVHDPDWREKLEQVQAMFPVVEDPASYKFSPSQLLGLATPPPPSTSSQHNTTPPVFTFHHELSYYSLQQSAGGTVPASPQIVTPTPEVSPREMPVGEEIQAASSNSNKATPVPSRTGPKTTPVSGVRTQGVSSSSAFTSPFTFRAPVLSQPSSVAPSPLKQNLSSDSLSSQQADTLTSNTTSTASTATRALLFDRIPEAKDEGGLSRYIEMRLTRDSNSGAGAAGPVPIESLPSIVGDINAQDSETLDQEVSQLTGEGDEGGGGKDVITSSSAPQQLNTPESVLQYMKRVNRIRFNSLTSQNNDDGCPNNSYCPNNNEKHARPGRARSCPPLHRKSGGGDWASHTTPTPSHSSHGPSLPHSKLDTVSESAVSMETKSLTGGGGGWGRWERGRGLGVASLQHQLDSGRWRPGNSSRGSEASSPGQLSKLQSTTPSPRRRRRRKTETREGGSAGSECLIEAGEAGEENEEAVELDEEGSVQIWPSGHSMTTMQEMGWVFQTLLAPVRVAMCRQCQRPLVEGDDSSSSAAATPITTTCTTTPATPATPANASINSSTTSTSTPNSSAEKGERGSVKRRGQSTEGCGSWISWPVGERALYTMLSPPELLDRHLAQGSELHAKELSHIPLTSQESISWTHFGGGPPVDEVNILRGEILLLHNQVMYERHKKNNHAMRNRRLLRRIAHVSALEEQVQALTDQLLCRDKDIQNLQISLKLLQDHNHRLQQASDSDQYEKLVDFKTTIQQNKDLQEANIELKNLLLTQKAENDHLKKELQEVRAQCFELEKDNQMMCQDMVTAKKWQDQVEELQKEMLLMGEAHERLQNLLEHQRKTGQDNITLSNNTLTTALKAEIKAVNKDKADLTRRLDASQCRMMDLEEFARSKDVTMAQLKNNFELSKAAHSEELKAVENKYQSMVHINQELQSQILRLQAETNCLQQKMAAAAFHRASRRHGNDDDHQDATRGASPRAGDVGQPSCSSSSPPPPPHPPPINTTTTTAAAAATSESPKLEEGSEVGLNPEHARRVSQLSRDSGRGSMLTSTNTATTTTTHSPHFLPTMTEPTSSLSLSLSADPPSSSHSKPSSSSSSSSSKPSRKEMLSKAMTVSSKKKTTKAASKENQQGGDASSELSEGGGHMLVDSRAMLNTDSEDNASQSSSGVYSNIDNPAH